MEGHILIAYNVVLIFLYADLYIDSKLARVGRRLHDYTQSIEVLERRLKQTQRAKAEEHVIYRE